MPKKTITQDIIYMVRQFTYVHEIAEISLFSGKSTRCGSIVFTLKQSQTLISKTAVFYLRHKAYQPKSSLYGLSVKKSPIKNYNNIILSQFIIWIKHN